ncbi:MAG: hypothetical protein SGI88_02970 [Candidatus Hydrogenedentes bacterium]|nr:hypothetical protein [Candidatus Hydrogenedentota bacterium]
MHTVLRIDQLLCQVDKPRLTSIADLALEPGDELVYCAGFEDRAHYVPSLVATKCPNDITVFKIIYSPSLVQNRSAEIELFADNRAVNNMSGVYDREDPAWFGEELLESIRSGKGRLFIDISAMSKLLIVQILAAVGKHSMGFSNCTVIYTEAEKYPPDQKEVARRIADRGYNPYDILFLSKGVIEVAIIPELSSVALQGQPTRLVFFPSFNVDQLSALRNETQPSAITLIHGIPPAEENIWRLKAIQELNNTNSLASREDFYASTLEYGETIDNLSNIYNAHGEFERIIVAPTGSKMQAVAVGIFRAFMDDITIAYPTPREFAHPEQYTSGCRRVYRLDLDKFFEISFANREM